MAGLGRRSHYRKHLTDAVLHDCPEPDERVGQRIARVVGTRGGNMFNVVVAPPLFNKEPTPMGADEVKAVGDDSQSKSEKVVTAETLAYENGGGKQYPSLTAETNSESLAIQDIQRASQLAFLPTKFRKLVWIKRNDFVIVNCGEEEDNEGKQHQTKMDQLDSLSGGGFRYVISHILYKDQVKHIKSMGMWPLDPFFADENKTSTAGSKGGSRTTTTGRRDDNDKVENTAQSVPNNNYEGYYEPQCGNKAYEDNGIVFDDPLVDEVMMNTNRLATLRVEDSSSEEDTDDG